MVNKKQRIDSGHNSSNFQANGDINVQQGMSYSEVKEVSMDVFRSNFFDLGDQVKEIIDERAEKVINDYLEKIMSVDPAAVEKTVDPDIRANIYEVQRDYARRGNDDIETLLVEMLAERTIKKEKEFKNLVLNEALDVASKLTITQIKRLFLIFFTSGVSLNGVPSSFYFSIINQIAGDLLIPEANNLINQDMEYLVQQGCISISIGSRDLDDFILGLNFQDIKNQADLDNLKNQEGVKQFYDTFHSTQRSYLNSTISPVGKAIVIGYIKDKITIGIDYDTFLS